MAFLADTPIAQTGCSCHAWQGNRDFPQFIPRREGKEQAAMREASAAEFERLARAVLARLPEVFARELTDVVLRVEEFATDEQLDSVGIEDPWDLTGLYEGVPLTERSGWDVEAMPPVITLFRQPLLAEMEDSGVGLHALVRHVVIHEAGHHFGLSDEDMHALEDAVED
jgi:predicted Zn-dependent protease with MMP-like domain